MQDVYYYFDDTFFVEQEGKLESISEKPTQDAWVGCRLLSQKSILVKNGYKNVCCINDVLPSLIEQSATHLYIHSSPSAEPEKQVWDREGVILDIINYKKEKDFTNIKLEEISSLWLGVVLEDGNTADNIYSALIEKGDAITIQNRKEGSVICTLSLEDILSGIQSIVAKQTAQTVYLWGDLFSHKSVRSILKDKTSNKELVFVEHITVFFKKFFKNQEKSTQKLLRESSFYSDIQQAINLNDSDALSKLEKENKDKKWGFDFAHKKEEAQKKKDEVIDKVRAYIENPKPDTELRVALRACIESAEAINLSLFTHEKSGKEPADSIAFFRTTYRELLQKVLLAEKATDSLAKGLSTYYNQKGIQSIENTFTECRKTLLAKIATFPLDIEGQLVLSDRNALFTLGIEKKIHKEAVAALIHQWEEGQKKSKKSQTVKFGVIGGVLTVFVLAFVLYRLFHKPEMPARFDAERQKLLMSIENDFNIPECKEVKERLIDRYKPQLEQAKDTIELQKYMQETTAYIEKMNCKNKGVAPSMELKRTASLSRIDKMMERIGELNLEKADQYVDLKFKYRPPVREAKDSTSLENAIQQADAFMNTIF